MKQFLIDTQILLWLINQDSRLNSKIRTLLENSNTQIMVSYVSFIEIVIKAAVGKMHYDDSIHDDLVTLGINTLPVDRTVLRHYQVFDLANKDPFDNLLLAVAKAGGYQFITSDRIILKTAPAGIKLFDAQT